MRLASSSCRGSFFPCAARSCCAAFCMQHLSGCLNSVSSVHKQTLTHIHTGRTKPIHTTKSATGETEIGRAGERNLFTQCKTAYAHTSGVGVSVIIGVGVASALCHHCCSVLHILKAATTTRATTKAVKPEGFSVVFFEHEYCRQYP